MNRISQLFLAIVLSVSTTQAQQMRSATWSTDRFFLRYRTILEPPRPGSPELNIGGGGTEDSTTNHRILTDTQQKKYFGYDLQVNPIPGGRFGVTFKPLTMQPDQLHLFQIDNSWSQIQLPSYPASVQVNDGETIALDLLINPSTGQKIVEYVTVSSPSNRAATVSSPRDLQLSDVQMSLESPRLRINGKSVNWNGGDAHGGVSGAIVWVYIPERGRFLLSFMRYTGFRDGGEVRGKNIKFTWNNETYELQSQGSILAGESAWNLYVYSDAGYRPNRYPPFLYGAMDRPPNP